VSIFKKLIIKSYLWVWFCKLASDAAAGKIVSEYNIYVVNIKINSLRLFTIYLTI